MLRGEAGTQAHFGAGGKIVKPPAAPAAHHVKDSSRRNVVWVLVSIPDDSLQDRIGPLVNVLVSAQDEVNAQLLEERHELRPHVAVALDGYQDPDRSEEHTSELQ